jgi:predicted GIY-YIG superfamily endonuclease
MPSGSTGHGTTIRILLLDGTPEGLRIIDKSGWNGLAMMCNRAKYPLFKDRDEFNFPGVYFLYGSLRAEGGNSMLYIGQADNVGERLDNHNRGKEFWTHLAVFTSRSGHLNRAHAQYLESRLIALAQEARRAEVLNGNAPRLPFLSESDRFDSESFLDQVLLLCPILGLDYFEQLTASWSSHGPGSAPLTPPRPEGGPKTATPFAQTVLANLVLSRSGAHATGRMIEKKLEVFAGGIARSELQPSAPGWLIGLRNKLIAGGILTQSSDGLVFTQNYLFRSPSAAASVMLGRTANGLTNWKDSQGRTLKSLQVMIGGGPSDDE